MKKLRNLTSAKKVFIKAAVLNALFSIIIFADVSQHKGNNFELSNKSDEPVYFSLSDPAEIFKLQTAQTAIDSFVKPTIYQHAPATPFLIPDLERSLATYKDKLITLAPGQSLATSVNNTQRIQLLLARGKSPSQLDELKLYRFTPNKTLFLKIDKNHVLSPQEGTLKPTLKGLKRFARSGGSLEYNVTPQDIQLVKTVTTT